MKTICALFLTAILLSGFVYAEEPAATSYSFTCGTDTITIESTCIYRASKEHLTQCTKQDIVLMNGDHRSVKLPHDGKAAVREGMPLMPLLDALVTSWTCANDKYILLGYTSRWYSEPTEWYRVFDLQGNDLTKGIKVTDGNAVVKLFQKLGLNPDKLKVNSFTY